MNTILKHQRKFMTGPKGKNQTHAGITHEHTVNSNPT